MKIYQHFYYKGRNLLQQLFEMAIFPIIICLLM